MSDSVWVATFAIACIIIMASISEDTIKKLVDDAFLKYDLNKNGTLDVKEVGVLMNDCMRRKNEPEATIEDIEEFFASIDTDGDGKVTREEMEKLMRLTYRGQSPMKK